MRVLVTGGAGFIGSHLVDALLSAGHEVAIVDDLSTGNRANLPEGARFYEADIRDVEKVRAAFLEFRPEAISLQAAQLSVSRSVGNPAFDADVNILGLLNVLNAAVEAGTQRVLFASSGGVLYGEATEPADESTPANPISPYGISKWAGERYLAFYAQEKGLHCTALRYSNVYGQRQNPLGEAGVVSIFCTKMLMGELCTINGDGKYIRDYVHVSDVVAANMAAFGASGTGFQAFNVGTGTPTDVNELAEKIRASCIKILKSREIEREIPQPVHGTPRPGDLRSNLVSYAKISSELNWQPKVGIDEGLEQTASWFADQIL